MKVILKLFYLLVIFCFTCGFAIQITNWEIDKNYSIQFSGIKVNGTFSGLKGIIVFNKNDLKNSRIAVTVDANTINTGNSTKDKHAKGESWFDTKNYPTIKFTSSSFIASSSKIIVKGTLELHGVKREIDIPFTFSDRNDKATFVGNFRVNRKDYAIKGNAFGFLVGDEFQIEIVLPVQRRIINHLFEDRRSLN